MFALVIAIIVGLIGKQKERFWKYSMFAFAIQLATGFLMSGGGTLENPAGDGLVTQFVRNAANDGPVMAIYGLFVIGLGWVIPLGLLFRGYERNATITPNNIDAAS
jgi:hypothetical protein